MVYWVGKMRPIYEFSSTLSLSLSIVMGISIDVISVVGFQPSLDSQIGFSFVVYLFVNKIF